MHLTIMDIEDRAEHHAEAADELLASRTGSTPAIRAQAHATMAIYYLKLLEARER